MTTELGDFSVKPILRGERIVLRPFRDDDFPAIARALRDPEVVRLTGSADFAWDEDAERRLRAWYGSRHEQHDRLDLAIAARTSTGRGSETRDEAERRSETQGGAGCGGETRDGAGRDGGAWVGEVVLNELDRRNASCNFRILVGPDGQDRGFGSEAVRLLMAYAFGQLRLHRVSLTVYDFNPRARHVYEKAGFVAEGTLRHTLRTPDGWADATIMAALAPDWHAAQVKPAVA